MNSRLIGLAFFCVVLVVEAASLFVFVKMVGLFLSFSWMAITFFIGIGFILQTPYRKPEDVRGEVMQGRMDVSTALQHLLLVKAGSLLMLPGLVSDLVGFALCLPIVRDWIIRKMIRDGQMRINALDNHDPPSPSR